MKSNVLLLVLLCLVLQSPAPAQEKPEGKKPSAPAAKRKFTDEERKLLAEAEKQAKQARELYGNGKYAEAEKEFRAVLAIRERVLGAEHPKVLQSCFDLALCLEAQKKFPEALAFIQRGESGLQKKCGADYADNKSIKAFRERIEAAMKATATADKPTFTEEEQKLLDEAEKRISNARAHMVKGKFAEAEKEFRAVLASYERVLGAEHPEVARYRVDLAMSLVGQKKYEEALAFIQKAESVWQKNFGADSWYIPEVKFLRERIEAEMKGVPFVAKRKFTDEEQKLLDDAEKQLEQAVVLDGQGKYAEAEKEYRAVSAIRERVLLADHPDTLKSRNHLARALQAQGKHAEAKKEFWAVLVLREHALGAEHPDVFQSCFNVALCLEAQKKFLEALVFIQRAERGWQKAFGADFSDTKKAKQARERIEEKMKAGK